jgi:uncharacterized protein (DUF1697 family)
MPRHVVLLRGVNLVKRNRIAMPELRQNLTAAGFRDVATYVQSGNVVLSRPRSPERVREEVADVIKRRFGLDITALVRSPVELADVLRRNPLAAIATNPRRYLVTFLSHEPPPSLAAYLASVATQEAFAVIGREVYSWHPEGIGRTPLWERLADRRLGVAATSRNWATVTTLAAMADESTSR